MQDGGSAPVPEPDPRVSAVICVVDPDPAYFPATVRSVLAQTMTDFELIIIEEPHGRRVEDVLQGIDDPRIRHFLHPHRTSLLEQRRRGLEHARSEIVALLDADDICVPERFAKQLAYLETHAEVSVLGSQLEIIGAEGNHLGYRAYPREPTSVARALPRYNAIAQPSVMLRKSAVLAAGGYQYCKHKYTEDYELWCRMAKQGFKLANHPEALLRYRVHPSGAKTSSLRSILLGTIDIKRMHYAEALGPLARARLWAEQMVLARLPPPLVLKLFLALQVRRRLPR
jgi:glycosyltransferase involved in cell wall biosynthesis